MTKDKTTTRELENGQTVGALLSSEERDVCEQVAAGDAPWSQRAQALLALDEGALQTEAGARAGLSRGQLQYWLDKFRQDGLSMFPEAVLAQTAPEPAPASSEKPVEAPPKEPGDDADRPKGKKKSKGKGKSKKKKKGKKSKAAKKAKKAKADKKPVKKAKKKMKFKE